MGLPSTFPSTFPGVVGGGGAPEDPDLLSLAIFDGIHAPKPVVLMAFGGETGITATTYRIGVGPGIGTGSIGGTDWDDIAEDVLAITINGPTLSELEQATAGTCDLEVLNLSGDYDPDNPVGRFTSGGVSLVDLDVRVMVRFEYDGIIYDAFTGVVDDIVPNDAPPLPTVTFRCKDGLAELGRASAGPSNPQYDGDWTGERIEKLADLAVWASSRRDIDPGRSRLGQTTLGDNILPLMTKVVETEFGLLYVDRSGILTFVQRHGIDNRPRSTAVQATIADTGGMVALERSKNRDGLSNTVAAARDPHPSDPFDPDASAEDEPVQQVAVSQTSVDTYGTMTFPGNVATLARTDTEVYAMATWLAPRYDGLPPPETIIRQVGVQGLGFGQWADLLGLQLLDRIEVQRDYGPVALDKELLVYGVSLEVRREPRTFNFAFTTGLPPEPEPSNIYRVGVGPGIGTGAIGF